MIRRLISACLSALVVTFSASLATADDQSDLWMPLLTRADSFSNAYRWDSAVAHGRSALRIVDSVYGPLDTNRAYALHRMGYYYNRLEADTSEIYFRKALQIWEIVASANPQKHARTLNNIGILVQRDGRFRESAELFQKALDLKRGYLPPFHNEIGTTIFNLSTLYLTMGKVTEAERCLHEASEIWDSAGVTNKSAYYMNISVVYKRQFRYDESIEASKEAMRLLLGAADPAPYYGAVGNLADAYLALGEVARADSIYADAELFDDTCSIVRDPKTKLAREMFWGLKRAHVNRLMGRFDQAEELLDRAESLVAIVHPTRHYDWMWMYDERGRLFLNTRQYSRALESYRLVCEKGEDLLGGSNPRLSAGYLSLAQTYLVMSQPDSAIVYARRAVDVAYESLPLLISTLPEDLALQHAAEAEQAIACYLEALRQLLKASTDQTKYAINLITRSKGLTTDLLIQRRREIAGSLDSTTARLCEKKRFATDRLSKALLETNAQDDKGSAERRIDSLRVAYQRACNDLYLHDTVARVRESSYSSTASDIAAVLPPDAAALEFFAFRVDDTGTTKFALVFIDNSGPQLFWIPNGTRVENLVREYRTHLGKLAAADHVPTSQHVVDYRRVSGELIKEVLGPVIPLVATKKALYISPAGVLDFVSFAGLCDEAGRYLVESFEIHTLDAVRELAIAAPRPATGRGILAMGDPDFDASPNSLEAGDIADEGEVGYHGPLVTRGNCAASLDTLFRRLPGTRLEIERLKANPVLSAEGFEVYLGAEAREEVFKHHAPGRRMLHLATHGFSLESVCDSNARRENTVTADPLLSCGLFLTGVKQSITNPDQVNGEDGVLYALEVAELDLSGVELVTLSACESAIGTIRGSDGLYGLRRAFVLAGSNAVMASLWQIPDDVSATIVASVYSHWRTSLPVAVRETQLEYIRQLRKNGLADHPFLWAGLVPYTK